MKKGKPDESGVSKESSGRAEKKKRFPKGA
jgi:hypothetical protein